LGCKTYTSPHRLVVLWLGLTTVNQDTANYINEFRTEIILSDQFDINKTILGGFTSDLGAGISTPPYQNNSEDENLSFEESNLDFFTEDRDSQSDFGNLQSSSIATSSSRITSILDNNLSTNLAMSNSHEDDSNYEEETSSRSDQVELNASERIVNDPWHSGVDDEGLPISIKGFGGRPLLEESNLRHSLHNYRSYFYDFIKFLVLKFNFVAIWQIVILEYNSPLSVIKVLSWDALKTL
jgi:hypothetical protein